MKDREHFIWKAKHRRSLTDEQIHYFLDRDPRYTPLPYYALCCKRLGCEQAYAEVLRQYGPPNQP